MNCCYIFTTNANKDNNELYKDLLFKSIETLLLFYDDNIVNIYILIDNKISNDEYNHIINNINNINNNRINIIYKLIDLNITNCIKYPESNINAWKINRIGLLKFFIPYLVNCDNILYIDSDILFNGNVLNDLYLNFNNDTLIKMYQYGYNSGLILFNCNKWRAEQLLLSDIIKYYNETEYINTVDNQAFDWLVNKSKYNKFCIKDTNYKINFPLTPPNDDWKNFTNNESYDWHNMNVLHLGGVEYKTYTSKIYNYIKNNC